MSRRSRRINKGMAQHSHFLVRFSERIGYVPSNETYDEIIRKIRDGESVHLHDQSLRVKIHGVIVNEERVVVVYDRLRGTLVTVLPKDSGFYSILEGKNEACKTD